ncbi:hypothetical protein [Micromonospora robiginosa]|uniref:Uncharacterized protein n=1 Tax=Micromonospora robiginosa TaxID=2749844 RepID=A0AAF0P1F2_9ACTN|nr:hypothetical protein [Micromonospora ferruginea]WMF04488.1 hypothetical protein H1D33_30110 [Micromonospora ferruginea]
MAPDGGRTPLPCTTAAAPQSSSRYATSAGALRSETGTAIAPAARVAVYALA